MDIAPIAALPPSKAPSPDAVREGQARAAAEAFEATFLAEMLKETGINTMPSAFGGGAGEDAFSSMLTQQYAELLAARGGIGLAEQIFEVLKQRTSGQ